MEVPRLEDYWARLEPCVKLFARDEQRAAIALYRELAKGEPVDAARLACALCVSSVEAQALLGREAIKAFSYSDEDGHVVGFRGLAVAPMHHRLEVDGRTLSTWCAWDSLFIPEILGREARVMSIDPENQQAIRLVVTPNRIEAVEPASAVMSFVMPDPQIFETSASNVMAKFCHFIFFFSSRESGERWVARYPGTFLYSLEEAYELARRANARSFGAGLAAPTPPSSYDDATSPAKLGRK